MRSTLIRRALSVGLIALAWWLAFVVRFDGDPPHRYDRLFLITVGVVIGLKLAVFVAFRLYTRWWRFTGIQDLEQIVTFGTGERGEPEVVDGDVHAACPQLRQCLDSRAARAERLLLRDLSGHDRHRDAVLGERLDERRAVGLPEGLLRGVVPQGPSPAQHVHLRLHLASGRRGHILIGLHVAVGHPVARAGARYGKGSRQRWRRFLDSRCGLCLRKRHEDWPGSDGGGSCPRRLRRLRPAPRRPTTRTARPAPTSRW